MNRSIGKLGEGWSIAYIKHLGYEFLSRNHRLGKSEADIIAIDRDTLVIIEVKTSLRPLTQSEWVGRLRFPQYGRLISMASVYSARIQRPEEVRIDLIGVSILRNQAVFCHFKDISLYI